MAQDEAAATRVWPTSGLLFVPHLDWVERFTDILVTTAGTADAFVIAEQLSIPVRFCLLDGAAGGMVAALIPDIEHPFTVLCERAQPSDRADCVRFRVAHELAHTMFYDWSLCPPRQVRRGCVMEERFCDTFAAALLRRQAAKRPVAC